MAKNTVHMWTTSRTGAVTSPATPASGDPVLFGQQPGVALSDEDADGNTTYAIDGVFDLSVKGEDNAGNAAIAAGDVLYYEAGQTPPINVDATNGVRFGYARGAVGSGATATIPVEIGY